MSGRVKVLKRHSRLAVTLAPKATARSMVADDIVGMSIAGLAMCFALVTIWLAQKNSPYGVVYLAIYVAGYILKVAWTLQLPLLCRARQFLASPWHMLINMPLAACMPDACHWSWQIEVVPPWIAGLKSAGWSRSLDGWRGPTKPNAAKV